MPTNPINIGKAISTKAAMRGGAVQFGIGRSIKAQSLSWWLSGGIDPTSAVAAYQPKGAASYAASKINLANAGTYDAADGAAYPTWDEANGWKCNGLTQYLTTGIIYLNAWSVLIRFSNVTSTAYSYLFGMEKDSNREIGIAPNVVSAGGARYVHYWSSQKSVLFTSGVLGIARLTCYANGYIISGGDALRNFSGTPVSDIWIGGRHGSSDALANPCTSYIQAFAIYNTTLTDAQVLAVSTAMAAL